MSTSRSEPARAVALATICLLLLAVASARVWLGSFDSSEEEVAGPPLFERIDLNRADQAMLETVPGIGPALAKRIVAEREANGPYADLAALERVPGIGPKLIEKVGSFVQVR